MPDFRIYFKDREGHIVKLIGLVDVTDGEAVAQAKQYVGGHDIEVWEGSRQVAVLDKSS